MYKSPGNVTKNSVRIVCIVKVKAKSPVIEIVVFKKF
jgi:hypothetical protein